MKEKLKKVFFKVQIVVFTILANFYYSLAIAPQNFYGPPEIIKEKMTIGKAIAKTIYIPIILIIGMIFFCVKSKIAKKLKILIIILLAILTYIGYVLYVNSYNGI